MLRCRYAREPLARPLRCAVLGWSAYEGSLQAMWRGYTPVLLPLCRAVDELSALAHGALDAEAGAGTHGPTEADADGLSLQAYACLVRSGADGAGCAALGAALDGRAKARGPPAATHTAHRAPRAPRV